MSTRSGAHRIRYELNGSLVVAGSRPNRLPAPGGLVHDGIRYDVLDIRWDVDADGESVQVVSLTPAVQVS